MENRNSPHLLHAQIRDCSFIGYARDLCLYIFVIRVHSDDLPSAGAIPGFQQALLSPDLQ